MGPGTRGPTVKRLRVFGAALVATAALYWWSHTGERAVDTPPEDSGETLAAPASDAAGTEDAAASAGGISAARGSDPEEPSAQQLEFKTFSAQVLSNLPTVAKLRALSDAELHHTPRALLRSAAQIGQLGERVSENPALIPQGLHFYLDCALRRDVDVSVRSICYTKLRGLERKLKLPPTSGSEAIPTEVVRAADAGLER